MTAFQPSPQLNDQASQVDAGGNIYVAGSTQISLEGQSYNGGPYDFFIAKFHADSTFAWTIVHGWGDDDHATALKAKEGLVLPEVCFPVHIQSYLEKGPTKGEIRSARSFLAGG